MAILPILPIVPIVPIVNAEINAKGRLNSQSLPFFDCSGDLGKGCFSTALLLRYKFVITALYETAIIIPQSRGISCAENQWVIDGKPGSTLLRIHALHTHITASQEFSIQMSKKSTVPYNRFA
jgi:hypothetical protein